jgi:hypothetical protein
MVNTMRLQIGCLALLSLLSGCRTGLQRTHGIDRFALVTRHNVVVKAADPWSPLSVGNGQFACTVDVTGLQTFGDFYYRNGVPLETLSDWAWHSFPNTDNLHLEDANKNYDVHGRQVAYASLENSPAGKYFRENPQRMPLGQIGLDLFKSDRSPAGPNDLQNIHQELNLWTGVITSRYEIEGVPIEVQTICHPNVDAIAIEIKSPLLTKGQLKPHIRFPYSYVVSVKNKPPFDWEHSDRHQTNVKSRMSNGIVLERIADDSRYCVQIAWSGSIRIEQPAAHSFILSPGGGESIRFVVVFSPKSPTSQAPSFESTRRASALSWQRYWTTGGAVDLSGSTDPRAGELERRIVLSQYLVKAQYAGTFPPQETGLTHVSWYGKHNSEMYWWHVAHFAQWGHAELMEKSLPWYQSILPKAQALAKQEGLEGARWPKMTGPDGVPGPGSINPFIIWNQPHVIYLAELCYRAHPERQTLEKYQDLVFETAKYLASYAWFNEAEDRYTLGPPIRSVSESRAENLTRNPTFELAYWHFGLSVAQTWRQRLGLAPDPKWDDVLQKLSRLPVQDGLYLDIETDPNAFQRRGSAPSSMLMALGVLPQSPVVDAETMHRTLLKVVERNGTGSFVSWSSGKVAMTAARLGEPNIAVDILCNEKEASRYLANGLVRRPKEPLNCPAYFPTNCSLLSAVALMAAGWDGAPPTPAPGFPHDGRWVVRWEGLQRLP